MRQNSSPNSRLNAKPGNTWANKILYWLDDQRKLGNSDGYTLTVSGEQIAAAVGTYRRRVTICLKQLEQDGLIWRTRVTRPVLGGDGPRKITLLPLSREKRQWVYDLAKRIDRTPGEAVMILDSLVHVVMFERLTVEELNGITGYDDPVRLARALIDLGFVQHGRVTWS